MADDLPMHLQRQLSVDDNGLPPLVGGYANDTNQTHGTGDYEQDENTQHLLSAHDTVQTPHPPPPPLPPPSLHPLPAAMDVEDRFVKILCEECDGILRFHCQFPGCTAPTWDSRDTSNSGLTKNRDRHAAKHDGRFAWRMITNRSEPTFYEPSALPDILLKKLSSKQRSSSGTSTANAVRVPTSGRRRSTGSIASSTLQSK